MVDRRVGIKSGRVDSALPLANEGRRESAALLLGWVHVLARIFPLTFRHHHKVVAASDAEIIAITVKGSAAFTVNSEPDTAAAMARAAVLDVANKPWRRLSSR
jgi:hypothetical protein